jgi:hypothetical protein
MPQNYNLFYLMTLLSSLLTNSLDQILSSLPMDLKNILRTKLLTLENAEKVINTSSIGLVMVPNTTNGFPAPHSLTAKHLTFGREGRTQPLGSFFPLGFLTPPNREPLVDVVIFIPSFYIMHDFNFTPPPPPCSFIACEGVNLWITYVPHHVCLSLLTCLLHCLVMDS